ncbi:MAG: hypothetical protein ACE1ZV_03520, partial [Alphaproteobacteria bacterium]
MTKKHISRTLLRLFFLSLIVGLALSALNVSPESLFTTIAIDSNAAVGFRAVGVTNRDIQTGFLAGAFEVKSGGPISA